MRKYITTLMMLLLIGAGVAQAQCVSYSLAYAVYASESVDNIQFGQVVPVPGSGTVTIGGHEQSFASCLLAPNTSNLTATPLIICPKLYDSGRVSITVNAFTKNVSYGRSSTSSSIASALANAFNADSTSPSPLVLPAV